MQTYTKKYSLDLGREEIVFRNNRRIKFDALSSQGFPIIKNLSKRKKEEILRLISSFSSMFLSLGKTGIKYFYVTLDRRWTGAYMLSCYDAVPTQETSADFIRFQWNITPFLFWKENRRARDLFKEQIIYQASYSEFRKALLEKKGGEISDVEY